MFNKILVVCFGNICRSPTAERLLQKYLPEKEITSAGIGALVGQSADIQAIKTAKKESLSLEGHLARQLTAGLCRENDLILVMEKRQMEFISDLVPEARGKIMLFGHWNGKKEIPDPYKKSTEAFESVYRLLDEAAHKWANAINS